MPSYRFGCDNCEHEWDEVLAIGEHKTPLQNPCIECGADDVYRVFTAPYVCSDDLGVGGVFNPADGKKYDSKSAYYQAVKDKGLEIMGNDAPTTRAKPKQKKIDWEKAVSETLKQLPLKGK